MTAVKTHLSLYDFAKVAVYLAIVARVEGWERLSEKDGLLTDEWRAVHSLGKVSCFAECIREFVFALELSDDFEFKNRMSHGEGFDMDELSVFQQIADEAGWQVDVKKAIFGPCANKVLEACEGAEVEVAPLIVRDQSISEFGLRGIGEVFERAENGEPVALKALDEIRHALDGWWVPGSGEFEYGSLPSVLDYEAIKTLAHIWVGDVDISDYMRR